MAVMGCAPRFRVDFIVRCMNVLIFNTDSCILYTSHTFYISQMNATHTHMFANVPSFFFRFCDKHARMICEPLSQRKIEAKNYLVNLIEYGIRLGLLH